MSARNYYSDMKGPYSDIMKAESQFPGNYSTYVPSFEEERPWESESQSSNVYTQDSYPDNHNLTVNLEDLVNEESVLFAIL